MPESVALFGGTFDPVHLGHLNSARELQQRLAFDAFYLVPCHLPPHREACGEAIHRKAMLELALEDQPGLQLDCSELEKDTTSYTIHTLRYWRDRLGPEASLVWVLGSDAFRQLHSWYQWQQLTDYANLLVMQRAAEPLGELPGELSGWLSGKQSSVESLKQEPGGQVAFIELAPWPVSATAVRDAIANAAQTTNNEHQNSTVKKLLPVKVWQYIEQQQLYR